MVLDTHSLLPPSTRSNPWRVDGTSSAAASPLELRARRAYGCDDATVKSLNGEHSALFGRLPSLLFRQQRKNAQKRGIVWDLTFPEWVAIWIDSGHASERGCGSSKFVMGRKGDFGPYSPANVYIAANAKNISDGYRFRRERGIPINPHCPKSRPGSGRGWFYVPRGARRYLVNFRGKYVGAFHTAAEAEARYRACVAEWERANAA